MHCLQYHTVSYILFKLIMHGLSVFYNEYNFSSKNKGKECMEWCKTFKKVNSIILKTLTAPIVYIRYYDWGTVNQAKMCQLISITGRIKCSVLDCKILYGCERWKTMKVNQAM